MDEQGLPGVPFTLFGSKDDPHAIRCYAFFDRAVEVAQDYRDVLGRALVVDVLRGCSEQGLTDRWPAWSRDQDALRQALEAEWRASNIEFRAASVALLAAAASIGAEAP